MDMNFDFDKDPELKEILRKKQQEILSRSIGGIHETEKFKRFHAVLVSYLKKSAITDFKILLIKYDQLETLPVDYYELLQRTLDSNDSVLNNYIIIDNKLNIISKTRDYRYTNSSDAHKLYISLSDEYAVFLIQPHARVSYFLRGESFTESVFYTFEDYKKYEEKKSIDKIDDIFKEYREHLKVRSIYGNFYVSKSHLHSLRSDIKSKQNEDVFLQNHKHVLQNKPEDRFRENLRLFLGSKLRANFLTKEYILENFKRLDIYLLDENGIGLYLIEVKWVGVSVHQDGKKLGTEYSAKDINPAAVSQSVDYLKQLHNEGKPIMLGFLAVYDARKENLPDTCQDIDEALFQGERNMHFRKFRKIPDFRVVNLHPS